MPGDALAERPRRTFILSSVVVRVLVPEAARSGVVVALPEDEAAHVTRVLRLALGDALRVFNGRGGEWHATICARSRAGVSVELAEPAAPSLEPRIRYTLALAALKGDGTDEAIRDGVMMGVAEVRPFVSARTIVSATALERAHRVERWRRVAVSAAKQCGRAVVPPIADVRDLATVLAEPSVHPRILLVEPEVRRPLPGLADVPAPAEVILAIGPEGGWTAEEVGAAESAGWLLVSLGGRTLRAANAPLAAMAACQAVWRDV